MAASSSGDTRTPSIEAKGIRRTYGQVEALRGADFVAYPGEVVALIGDNGAGKSTLTRVLVGADQPTSGEILIDGEVCTFASPTDAISRGIGVVYQDLALAEHLDIPANMFLGREILRTGVLGRFGVLDRKQMKKSTADIYDRFGVLPAGLDRPVAAMSGGQRQSIAVARSVAFGSRIVFMDEPTAALGVQQTAKVLKLIRRIRDEGTTVILISHNMSDVLEVADRVEVLRMGQRVAQFTSSEATLGGLVAAMTGGAA
jgi:simple sugar transport system ATP-binding protein